MIGDFLNNPDVSNLLETLQFRINKFTTADIKMYLAGLYMACKDNDVEILDFNESAIYLKAPKKLKGSDEMSNIAKICKGSLELKVYAKFI